MLRILLLAAIALAPGALGSFPLPSSLLPGQPLVEIVIVDARGAPFTFAYPTSILAVEGGLLVLDGGRAHYGAPYDGIPRGALWSVEIKGALGIARPLVGDLADPIGLARAEDGTLYVSEYGIVSRFDAAGRSVHASGFPLFDWDAVYLPGGDEEVLDPILDRAGQAGFRDAVTTGTMSLAFAPSGELLATQAANGRPPDDPLLGTRGYATELSSSILRIEPGEANASVALARGCRNCFDLAFAPAESPYAGRLFATENTDFYRLRIQNGEDRTVLAGSTAADEGILDSLVSVDPVTGRIARVATFAPNGATLAAVPAGLAFAPAAFAPTLRGLPVVALMAADVGFAVSPFRGLVAAVVPDDVTGLGATLPIAQGLRAPVDVAFDDRGRLYVVEYAEGRLWAIEPRS